jgi:CheY-like chemotaxis protein
LIDAVFYPMALFIVLFCLGLACGGLLLHWLALGLISVLAAIATAMLSETWLSAVLQAFGALIVLQVGYLAGSVARIRLQVGAAPATAEPQRNAQQSPPPQLRILIAEDEPLATTELENEVRARAAEPVGPAATVEEALKLAEGTIDAAVLDIRLIDGDVTRVALRLLERGIPVVIRSGVHTPADIYRYRIPVFTKPVSAASPVRAVLREVERRRALGA